MGFFSDLKDDLSQAVNELLPEEEVRTEAELLAEAEETDDKLDLEAMLENVEAAYLPAEETGAPEEAAKTQEQEDEYDLEESLKAALAEKEEKDIEKDKEKEVVKMDVQMRSVSDETAVITAGMTITGDVSSEGSMEVIGTINGNVDILGKLNITGTICGNSKAAEIYADNAKVTGEVVSEGSVKIGQSSVIIGNIMAKSAVIAGAVKGDIDVQGPVILDTSAIVMGNIKSKSVQINNGAVIEGMCSQCYADVNPTSFFDEYKKNKKN